MAIVTITLNNKNFQLYCNSGEEEKLLFLANKIKYAELNLPIPEASLRGIDGKFSFGPFCFDYNNRGKPRGIYPKEIKSLLGIFPAACGVIWRNEQIYTQKPQYYGTAVSHGISSKISPSGV